MTTQDDHSANQKRLLELLEHAVKVADEWYDDSHGGRIEGDALIDEARALVASLGNSDDIQADKPETNDSWKVCPKHVPANDVAWACPACAMELRSAYDALIATPQSNA